MHSSRMRTIHSSSCPRQGVSTRHPLSVMAFWCGGLLLWPSAPPEDHTRRPPSIRRPPNQKAITEGHNRRPQQKAITEGHTPPGSRPPGEEPPGAGTPQETPHRSRPPLETCCKACWDTTCNACWDTTPPLLTE